MVVEAEAIFPTVEHLVVPVEVVAKVPNLLQTQEQEQQLKDILVDLILNLLWKLVLVAVVLVKQVKMHNLVHMLVDMDQQERVVMV
jgi:hypothetical protein